MISFRSSIRRASMAGAILLAAAACKNTSPGNYGESCNFEADMPCAAGSFCINSVCDKLCTGTAECNGGACVTYNTLGYGQVDACEDPTGNGGGGGGSSGSGSSGPSGSCSTTTAQACQNLTQECSSCATCQAPCYCAAACDCACAGDTQCEQQNRAAAQSLGTTCSY